MLQANIRQLISAKAFEFFIIAIIIVDSLLIGVETHYTIWKPL